MGGIGAVVIGRNEGARLEACLASLAGKVTAIVYVDSGSTDNSLEIAARYDAQAISLDMAKPFTAARARNIGWRALDDLPENIVSVQFVDGDCEVVDGWLEKARIALLSEPTCAGVCGRRLERYPDASLYNYLCHLEWNTPIGEAKAIGGDALMRLAALRDVGGYNDAFIAGEEPEMCVRLRAAGWSLSRIDADMTLHDAAMTRFGQWWQRTKRGGYAFALGAHTHGAPPERHFVKETRRAVFWGIALPAIILAGSLFNPICALAVGIYPLQIIRLALKSSAQRPWALATFLTIGKFAEAMGVFNFCLDRMRGRQRAIIEYKTTQ
jgi:glycosyltransferase involved in cell wall biosynthesis